MSTSPIPVHGEDRPVRRPKLPVHAIGPRVLGRHPLRHLRQDQEFRTLATNRQGYVYESAGEGHVRCDFDGRLKNLHPDVIVWAL